ncbi:DUF6519 domain-containing protein [Devosia sp.]|uniref:DUF6519 domain-containing protein n=1 Tax=Devosia sp. TaxID=1871048 RepID=UPI00273663D8|nr:DUF6519 domain-containing protein [Devosia sp.]MDP2782653.1 DUF6519 domain-containing protein [Devosia sp.]MDZ4346935.1 DUF6519 domain-containing protein [Candidatus Binatia bacterium]
MKGDFTRDTFNPTKHFSRVLIQQGRVTLEADHNEQTDILLHYLRTLARDLIGPYAAPIENQGFLLKDAGSELEITRGRCYVDGILVENESDCTYATQPIVPDHPSTDEIKKDTGEIYWIYLDVWERLITSIEDDAIREKALNGPDTCARAKVTWQVKALPVEKAIKTKTAQLEEESERIEKNKPLSESDTKRLQEIKEQIAEIQAVLVKLSTPAEGELDPVVCQTPLTLLGGGYALLSARVDPGKKVEDACVTPPDAKYRGTENQLYRVEIHDGSNGATASFKWSRDNGSVAMAWLGLGSSGNDLRVSHTRGFEAGNWVELSYEKLDLLGLPGEFVKLAKVEGDTLSADLGTVDIQWSNQLKNPKVRRWDQSGHEGTTLKHGVVPIKEGVWINLEDGIQIKFDDGGEYRTGDYWLIPARVATGKIEWPGSEEAPDARQPHGIEHHYAPLGFVTWQDTKWKLEQSCGCVFEPQSSCFVALPEKVKTSPKRAPAKKRRTR